MSARRAVCFRKSCTGSPLARLVEGRHVGGSRSSIGLSEEMSVGNMTNVITYFSLKPYEGFPLESRELSALFAAVSLRITILEEVIG